MRVTFMNQLALAGQGQGNIVCYRHPFRINVDIYIRAKKQETQDWELLFRPQNEMAVSGLVRAALAREFKRYIRQRVKRNPSCLRFDDFIDMARAVNING